MTNDMINEVVRAWDQYGDQAVLVSGAALVLMMTLTAWRFAKSARKDRWVDRVAAVLVLAWTSEGMWEIATQRLGFPIPFAVATFFVVEAMLLSSAMRATQHRETTGVPGPSGTLVWVLAGLFGFIVALNAGSPVEFALRAALPLAAVSLWWTGLTAERATDTDEMRTERWRRAQSREATWTVTPRSLLVRWGLMKPGKTTTTEAQREHQVRRMVVCADRAATASRFRGLALRRLRKMTRTADAEMVAEVATRVDRARRAEELMVFAPAAGPLPEPTSTQIVWPPPAAETTTSNHLGRVVRTTSEVVDRTTGETSLGAMVRTTGDGVVRTTHGPVDRTTHETTGESTSQTTSEPTQGSTRRTTRKGGSKSRRRTRAQLKAELEEKVEEVVQAGGEIQVQPLAKELRANRTTIRELLDEMGIRPMVRRAANQ